VLPDLDEITAKKGQNGLYPRAVAVSPAGAGAQAEKEVRL
jgi:hypothetical protein